MPERKVADTGVCHLKRSWNHSRISLILVLVPAARVQHHPSLSLTVCYRVSLASEQILGKAAKVRLSPEEQLHIFAFLKDFFLLGPVYCGELTAGAVIWKDDQTAWMFLPRSPESWVEFNLTVSMSLEDGSESEIFVRTMWQNAYVPFVDW